MPTGRLVVCATPIGNLGDVSERLRDALGASDVIYAEDTRRTAKLLNHLAISVPLVSLFSGNEQAKTEQLVEAVKQGQTVALVSDAGMPTISDPGAAAVRAVREAGGGVTVVPGPSAVTTALTLSGFGGDRFVFEGFLPRKGRERRERLSALAEETRPAVIFASPKRLLADLEALADTCGSGRGVAITRELTKLHEEAWVGSLEEAIEHWDGPVKGEITMVLGPGTPNLMAPTEAIEIAKSRVQDGTSVSEAAREVSDETGVSRREIYEGLLADQESS